MIPCLRRWTTLRVLSAPIRFFSETPIAPSKPLPPRLKINDADISISYLKGTGPGGQKINKTNSAVQIIHKPSGVVIKCQATRSQSQNAKIARSLLADRVEAKEKGLEDSRIGIKAAAARKKKASKMKKARRKYRELEDGAKSKEVEEEDEIEIVWDEDVKPEGSKSEGSKPAGDSAKSG
ncbi:hypothetical protein N7535_006143 [Penicillium sp. DV-2018c]|nr:hypothetical protein N7461_007775 [Penicillium sp. DV-2018c]KAJ5566837.1 hypothetical protein N7535_006143 [Penicillium sp. DV-2018c]